MLTDLFELVMRGLDPRIHPFEKMDCRVSTLRVGPAMTKR
jgi:hypothetical protein